MAARECSAREKLTLQPAMQATGSEANSPARASVGSSGWAASVRGGAEPWKWFDQKGRDPRTGDGTLQHHRDVGGGEGAGPVGAHALWRTGPERRLGGGVDMAVGANSFHESRPRAKTSSPTQSEERLSRSGDDMDQLGCVQTMSNGWWGAGGAQSKDSPSITWEVG